MLLSAVMLLIAVGCASHESRPSLRVDDVVALAGKRDFFALRALAASASTDVSPARLLAEALLAHAFNRLDESNAHIHAALARGGLSDSLVFRLHELEANNHLRRFRYRDARAALDRALSRPPPSLDDSALDDVRNLRRVSEALAPYPPQTVLRRSETRVRFTEGHVDATVQDSARRYIFDTGANLSTMARSEAISLGLTIVNADIAVGSSTDIRNTADIAVADRLTIGGLDFRNVVFLVFDDHLLTFPGIRIRGIIGFPVVEAMGEIRLRPSGELIVPDRIPERAEHNLAIAGHTPLTTVAWSGDTLLCRLDTGASTTDFYEPFYTAYRRWVDSTGHRRTVQTGGVGGIRAVPAYELIDMSIGVGDTTFALPKARVFTSSLARTPAENYLACNVGHDVFDAFREYVINFRSMSFLLR